MAEGKGFEPLWTFALTVFKFCIPIRIYWNIRDLLPLLWIASNLGKALTVRKLYPQSRMASRKTRLHARTPENGQKNEKMERTWRERREK